MFKKLFLILFFLMLSLHSAQSMEVAITVDDLIANGDLPPDRTRADIMRQMLAVFKKHNIKGVYGFMNSERVYTNTDGITALQEWVKAGHYLGNHTYHHVDLAQWSSQDFIKDIQSNEALLTIYMNNPEYHYFRYPYLAEGNTQEKRDSVRQFLNDQHYKIAEVTLDFFEYEWNNPYVRCVKAKDHQAIDWLKQTYLEQAENALVISHELSQMLFNRDIKYVLLIHINAFSTEMLDALLTAYEKQNVQFISLSDALADEAYQINPNIIRDRTYTFLNQVRLSRGLDNPEIVNKLYATLPEEKLSQICLPQ